MGKGGGEQNVVQEFKPPEWTAKEFPEYVARGKELANAWATDPNLIYGNNGQRLVSPLVQEQIDAIGGLRGMAMPFFGNSQRLIDQGTGEHQNYMSALWGNMKQGPSQANAFMGVDNPYAQKMISQNAEDMARGYATGTQASRMAGASRARAMGGTAEAELAGMQDKQLADSIGEMATGVRNNLYQQSAGMDEARIGRDWNAAEQGLQRQFGAVGMQPQRQQGNIALMQALLGGGEMSRNLDQQQIEAAKNLHYQNVQAPLIGLDIYGGALTRGSGGAGQQTSQMFGSYNPWQTGMGIAGMAGGLMNSFK
jgi:hypothetical protein